ncbi:MAG: hypothetical protein LBL65_05995 [Campylobacteraceae bacterium]|jgi:hypothetical protein|nr:hypothetical protein [Campylobacteraceae bacterium]
MQIEIYKEQMSNIKQELSLIDEETNTLLSERQKEISFEENSITDTTKDKKYSMNITSFIFDEAKERSEKLMYEIRTIVPDLISSDSRFNYLYMVIAFIFLLLLISFVKQYIF